MRNILVTGGAGFIGSNFIHHMLGSYTDVRILNVDCLTYAGDLSNLVEVESDIESARRYYNGAVRELNIAIESFPSNLVATQFKFAAADFFELRLPSIAQAPSVSL